MTDETAILLKNVIIEGKNSNLRIASENDAEFILELRLNPTLNKFIGETDPSVEKQRQWINRTYQNKNDFHFIIEDKNNVPWGTIAVYGIDYKKCLAEWGRWITKPNTPITVSIESAILVQYFAYKKLNLKSLHGGANNLNWQVVNFHKMYANVVSIDDTHTWFTFDIDNLKTLAKKYRKFHNIEAELNLAEFNK